MDILEIRTNLEKFSIKKLKQISEFISDKKIQESFYIEISSKLELEKNETNILKKIFSVSNDGNVLSLLINQFILEKKHSENNQYKLVVSGRLTGFDNVFTHDKILQMIWDAEISIKIVGYWVFEFESFFNELVQIQESKEQKLKIEFYLDSARKWKGEILKNWKISNKPKIYTLNEELVGSKIIKTLHAKMIIIDNKECLITSANLTINAMEDNIEAGIWTNDKKIVNDSIKLLNNLVEKKVLVNSA